MISSPQHDTVLEARIPKEARNWRNDPRIRKWCRQFTDISEHAHQVWLDRIERDPTIRMFAIRQVQREGNEQYAGDVGVCGLTSINQLNQSAEFSLYIAPEYQKHSHGVRALHLLCEHGFLDLNLNRIWGEVFEGNPAIKIFESLGFQKEGTLRESYFREGKFINSHIISVLRGKFLSERV